MVWREALVPQPQRDLADVAGGLENHQGTNVPQHMGGCLPARDRRLGPRCGRDVQFEPLGEAASGHPPSHCIQEQVAVGNFGADGEPRSERTSRLLPQRQDAGPPSLAHDPDLVEPRHPDIVEAEADQFGAAEPGVVGEPYRTIAKEGTSRYGQWPARLLTGRDQQIRECCESGHSGTGRNRGCRQRVRRPFLRQPFRPLWR